MVAVFEAPDANASFRGVQRVPVKVGGRVIPAAAISNEMQHHPADTPLESWQAAARALAVRELLLAEARRLAIAPEPIAVDGKRETEDEALVRQLVDREVATPEPDGHACRRYYEANAQRFRSADLFEAAHILIAARRTEPGPFAAARERAAALCAMLAERPGRFAELAEAHSNCPSAKVGGSLGQIKRGDTTPEFETALLALAPGATTPEPVETRYGFHVIRLARRVDGRQMPFEAAAPRIAAYLLERSRRTALAQYLARLAAKTEVSGVELPTPFDLRVA